MHNIYEGIIYWTINDDSGHPCWVEIPNYLYVTKGCERIISPQHWSQNATSYHAYATNLYVTQCVTHNYCATLISVGGKFVRTVPLDKQHVFTLHIAPGYTMFTT